MRRSQVGLSMLKKWKLTSSLKTMQNSSEMSLFWLTSIMVCILWFISFIFKLICVFASLGKTTLTDSLLAYDGIISQRQAGQLRFLDNRPDEQERGITMKCSSVLLKYRASLRRLYSTTFDYLLNRERPFTLPYDEEAIGLGRPFSIHIIDSPGHVDFYGQVYCGAKLADGCLILIDVVEGLCSQTISSLRLAFELKLVPILFFNKIDRLFIELMMSPLEVYQVLWKLYEQVNAFCGLFRTATSASSDGSQDGDDSDLEMLNEFYFDPRKGNIIFGSAIDGWAFRTNLFANLYSKKLALSLRDLNHALWGPYCLKQGQISNTTALSNSSLFVQLILENIYQIYRHTIIEFNDAKIVKIASVLNIVVSEKEISGKDKRVLLRTLLKSWVPLAPAVFDSFVDTSRSPCDVPMSKYADIMSFEDQRYFEPFSTLSRGLPINLTTSPVVAYISKVLPSESLDVHAIFGLARLYSGTLRVGDSVFFVFSQKSKSTAGFLEDMSDPAVDTKSIVSLTEDGYYMKVVQISSLFVLFGSDMRSVPKVHAGHIFAVGGLIDDSMFVKSGSILGILSPEPSYKDLRPLYNNSKLTAPPLLKVSVEPLKLKNLSFLQKALFLLYRNDPSVEIEFLESGEYVIAAAGELHLEQLLKDLKERWIPLTFDKEGGFEISVSEPIVPWRETISNNLAHSVSLATSYCRDLMELPVQKAGAENGRIIVTQRCLDHNTGEWIFVEVDLAARKHIDVDQVDKSNWKLVFHDSDAESFLYCASLDFVSDSNLGHTVHAAFRLAISRGPVVSEPIHGVEFYIYSVKAFKGANFEDYFSRLSMDQPSVTDSPKEYVPLPLTGALISILKDSFLRAFLEWSPRLLSAFNSVEIHTPRKDSLHLIIIMDFPIIC